MTLFGLSVTKIKNREPEAEPEPERKPLSATVNIFDWIKRHRSPRVVFTLPWSPSKTEVVRCCLFCEVDGNTVFTDDIPGRTPEDALQNAVAEIEKTIGDGWRTA